MRGLISMIARPDAVQVPKEVSIGKREIPAESTAGIPGVDVLLEDSWPSLQRSTESDVVREVRILGGTGGCIQREAERVVRIGDIDLHDIRQASSARFRTEE